VAHAAVYNWYTQVGADYSYEMPRFGGFWTPEQQAVFKTASPHYGAANFATPTLVVHGQNDLRVPGEPRHRAVPRAATEGRADAPRVLQGREPLGAQARQLAGVVREFKDWLDKHGGGTVTAAP